MSNQLAKFGFGCGGVIDLSGEPVAGETARAAPPRSGSKRARAGNGGGGGGDGGGGGGGGGGGSGQLLIPAPPLHAAGALARLPPSPPLPHEDPLDFRKAPAELLHDFCAMLFARLKGSLPPRVLALVLRRVGTRGPLLYRTGAELEAGVVAVRHAPLPAFDGKPRQFDPTFGPRGAHTMTPVEKLVAAGELRVLQLFKEGVGGDRTGGLGAGHTGVKYSPPDGHPTFFGLGPRELALTGNAVACLYSLLGPAADSFSYSNASVAAVPHAASVDLRLLPQGVDGSCDGILGSARNVLTHANKLGTRVLLVGSVDGHRAVVAAMKRRGAVHAVAPIRVWVPVDGELRVANIAVHVGVEGEGELLGAEGFTLCEQTHPQTWAQHESRVLIPAATALAGLCGGVHVGMRAVAAIAGKSAIGGDGRLGDPSAAGAFPPFPPPPPARLPRRLLKSSTRML